MSENFGEALRREYGKALEGAMNRKVGESPPVEPMGPASDYEHDDWRYPCETCGAGRKCIKGRKAYSPCAEGCEPCEHLREMTPEWKRTTSVEFRCDCDDDCYNTIYTNVSWDLYIEGTWHPEMRFSDLRETQGKETGNNQ